MEDPSPTQSTNSNRTRNGSGKPDGWDTWLTAVQVARRLRCHRQHVYRLALNGDLTFYDGMFRGRLQRRFEPGSVEAYAQSRPQNEQSASSSSDDDSDSGIPGAEYFEESDLEREGGGARDGALVELSRLMARGLTDLREVATDARKGQHEAYSLIAVPSREMFKLALDQLRAAYKRIRELEERLNRLHDEQRDARRDDREFSLVEKQLNASAEQKDQFFKMLLSNVPTVFAQLKDTIERRTTGPLARWTASLSPEKQTRLVGAIEAVMSVEDELKSAASPSASSDTEGQQAP
ncbi:MAG TPA: helix-turn-helix domain-containing protein [Polyangiaceae bacterium]|nr:helix-turn-helix domain-containing protein [Polyangiaceae bacterium]